MARVGFNLLESKLSVVLAVALALSVAEALSDPSWYVPPPGWDAEPEDSGAKAEGEQHGEHWHKPLFPMDTSDYLGFFAATLGLILASGGGIGGGGMLVPLYVLVMGFSPKHAIPLSNVTVFGGSVANFVLNRPKRHPAADRPLMDYDLILVMQPMTIAGALLGSVVNKVLPELVLTVCLVALLAATTRETLAKGRAVYAKETAALAVAAHAGQESALTAADRAAKQGAAAAEEVGLLAAAQAEEEAEEGGLAVDPAVAAVRRGGGGGARSSPEPQASSTAAAELAGKSSPRVFESAAEAELAAVLREEAGVPWWKLQVLWAIFAVVIAVNVLKGGGGFPSPVGITCGSRGYWLSTLAMFCYIVALTLYVRRYLVDQTAKKKRLGYAYAEGDIAWDAEATLVYPAVCIGAGLCAGMFGIGGGIVQVPLMLHLGVHPQVASASSATMILYTSFTALTSFYVFGLLLEDYAAVCFWLGLAVTAVGQLGTTRLIKALGRDSIIIFSVAAVVGVSALLMGTHSLLSMARTRVDLRLGTLCEAGENAEHA